MASSFSDLGIELMSTGENAGTWGDKTNTNLQIVEKAIAGYVEKAVTSGGTTALTITDGTTTESDSVARHAVIKLTGTITGNSIVTVPDSIEKVYIVTNGTSGAYTVQFKTASGTGITFGVSEKTTRLVYSDGTNLVDAGFGGATDMEGRELVLDADGDTTITADTDDQIDIKIAGADDFQFTANTFTAQSGSSIVVPESGLTFGSTAITSTAAELNLLDGVSGLVQADFTKLAAVDSTAAELNIVDGGTSATSTTVADADRVVLNDNGTMVQVAVTDLAAYFDDEITAMPNLTSVGTLTTLTVDSIIINGANIGHTSDADALAIDSSGNVTASQNLIVTGDLTVSGDDITMGTNTAGNILVADGTNFNSVAVGGLSEISTVANDDVFLAVDTSGGGLKKIARSAVVSGLASSAAISNVVEDTTPQLGGNLDTNSANILIDDAHFIADENGNEQLIFQTTSSAVNQFDITNAATGNAPEIASTGGDTNIDLKLTPKGSGVVMIDGNVGIETGVIDLKNGGTASKILFYCESSNAHAQTLQSAAHSVGATNTLTLPGGSTIGNSAATLVSDIGTQTLTNKTLTTPVIAEIDSGSTITLDATTDIVLDADGGDVFFKDGGTTIATLTNSSSDFVITTGVQDKDFIIKGDDGGAAITALTIDMSAAGAATFNDKIVATELDISGNVDIDGTLETDALSIASTTITSTAAEINLIDGGATVGTTAVADGDGILHNDGGTMKVTSAATFKTYFTSGVSSAADDITIGDAAVTLSTSSGNITIDATANDTDIIFKGTDATADITMLTLDGSDAGSATFNDKVIVGDGKLVLNSTAVTSTAAELNLLDGVSGLVQADLTKLAAVDSTAAELNIVDGGTSATSTTLVDADRVVVNDNGTMVQVAMTDVKTYIGGGTSWQAVKTGDFTAAAGQGIFVNTTSSAITITLPSGTIGDEVSIVDYAGTFDSNACTVTADGSEKIFGSTDDLTVSTERAAFTLVFTDSTQGWLFKND
jgi:hypothetical protein